MPAGAELSTSRCAFMSIVVSLACVAMTMAATPVWTGHVGYGKTFGFGVLETVTPGQEMVLVTIDPSSGDNWVNLYRAGPGQDSVRDLMITEPNSIGYLRTFGADLGSVGDVNGDGHDDFVICAPLAHSSDEDLYPAGFYLYYGGPSMDANPDLTVLSSAGTLRLFARGVVGGGDWNADGYDDFVIAAYQGNTPVAVMYMGGPTPDSVIDLVLQGPKFWYSYQHTLLFADLNGDGADDLISSAEGSFGGTVEVYLGGPFLDPVADVHFPREGSSASIGVGNINGDIYDDLVIVAGSSVRVYYGAATLDTVADIVYHDDPERFSLHHQARVEVIRTDPTEAGGDIWVSTRFYEGIVVFDGDGGSTSTPEYAFPSGPGNYLSDSGELFVKMRDVNGDGAEEFLTFDTAYAIHAYDDVFFDCDADGLSDNQEVVDGTLVDCDGNGLADLCETIVWPTVDCNADQVLDSCQMSELDCDLNGEIDSCEIADWQARDCNGNDVLDLCENLSAVFDCDANGVADCMEIALDGSKDCDGSGRLDICEYDDVTSDCNENGWLDHCEMAAAPSLDCNRDGLLDLCQSEEQGMDCDMNGVPDICEGIGESVLDCDHNGKVDLCEMEQAPALDCDGNGWLDACDDTSWGGPCRPRPWIQAYFDEALSVTTVASDTLPTFGTIRIAVRGLHAGMADAIDRFEFSIQHSPGLLIYGGTLPAGAYDLGPGTLDWLVVLPTPLSADAEGDLVLLEVSYVVIGAIGADSRIGLAGSTGSEAWTLNPVLHDTETGELRLLDTRSSWIDLSFVDCNHNDVDDAEDIAQGYSNDSDGNGIPDECQATAVGSLPGVLTLAPVSPNPFNPTTEVRFTLPHEGRVRVEVFDFAGRLVRLLLDETRSSGEHVLEWNGRDDTGNGSSSGVYLLRVSAEGVSRIRKMALLK